MEKYSIDSGRFVTVRNKEERERGRINFSPPTLEVEGKLVRPLDMAHDNLDVVGDNLRIRAV